MSSLLFRSAINTAVAAARCSRHSSFPPKSQLSTLSFPITSFNHDQCDGGDDVRRSAPMAAAKVHAPITTTHHNTITSYLTNIVATISGDYTLTTIEKAARQLEEQGEWEDIPNTTTTTAIMESPQSDISIWQISTLKRRRKKMNKHKLRKRRKKMRLKTRRQ